MNSTSVETTASCCVSKADALFLLRRLHSLTGIIPLGGFLLFHFFENASARHGADAFNETVKKISEMPYLMIAEWGVLLIPILFHGIYGLFITANSRPNVIRQSYARNWAYLFQRVTGIIAFVYIFLHVVSTRMWALFVKGSDITFQDMQTKLSEPWYLILYVIGILAVVYHFCNGIWSFSITWGLVQTQKGQRLLATSTFALFLVLSVVGLDILSAFILQKSILTSLGI